MTRSDTSFFGRWISYWHSRQMAAGAQRVYVQDDTLWLKYKAPDRRQETELEVLKNYMTSIFRNRQLGTTVSAFAVALAVAQLAACGPTEPPPEPHTAVTARAVNYTDQGAEFSINHAAGGAVSKFGESGINCCIGIPDKWRPGLKVKVYVQNDAMWLKYKDPDRWQETELELPPYPEPGDLYVAILPDDKVEVFASVSGPGGTNWPFRLGHPHIECLKTRSKAACGVE